MARDPKSINAEIKALENLAVIEARLLALANRRTAAARQEKQQLKEKKEAIEKYVEKLKESDEVAKDASDTFKGMTETMSLSSRATNTMSKSLSVATKNFRGIQSASKAMLNEGIDNLPIYNASQQISKAASDLMDAQQNILNAGVDLTAAEAAELNKNLEDASSAFTSIVTNNKDLLKAQPQLNQYVADLTNSFRSINRELEITQGLTADEIDQYKELTAEGERLKTKFKSVGDMIITALKKPAVLLGAAIMAIGQAVSKLGESFREFGGDLGGAVYSATALSLVFKEGTNVAKGLASEFGSMKDISFGTQLNTNLMAVNLGISGDEAAKLVGGFARLNKGSIDIANNMVATTKALSEAAGVNTAAVSADIAENMGKFSEYSNDGGENLITAGVAAAQLGVNLGTIANVSDTLLDFQSSITKELELGAMLGRNINFNEARTLLYRGKQASGIKSILKELGGVAAYNNMEYYQRKEVAATLGISVDELQRMVTNMDKLNEDGSIQLSTFDRTKELLTSIATGPFGMLISSAGALIMTVGTGIFQFKLMKHAVDRITSSILQMNAAQNSGNLTSTLSNAPGPMTRSGAPDRRFKANRLPAPPPGPPPGPSNVNKMGGGINMKSVLQGAAAMLILAGAMFVFAKAAQEFGDGVKWDQVFIGIGAMATLGVVAGVLGIGPIAAAVGIGTALILGLSAAFFIFSTGALIMATAVTMIANSLPLLASGISSLVPMIGGIFGLSAAFTALGFSLAVLGSMGLLALPVLLGIGAAAAGLGILFGALGVGDSTSGIEGGSLSEYESTMLNKMDSLIQAVTSNKDVYLDKDKVTSLVMQRSDRSIVNKLNIFNA
jgi:hypothetical protein